MGCDIHLFVEQKIHNVWVRVPNEKGPRHPYYRGPANSYFDKNAWDVGRNYRLFGLLAGVRANSIESISDPKGIPSDVSQGIKLEWEKWYGDAHTPSWYSLSELLNVKNNKVIFKGFVNIKQYKEFKNEGEPFDWALNIKDVSFTFNVGKNQVKIISNDEMERIINLLVFDDGLTYCTEIVWEVPYSKISSHLFDVLVPAMQQLDPNPDNVRMVFWFDN